MFEKPNRVHVHVHVYLHFHLLLRARTPYMCSLSARRRLATLRLCIPTRARTPARAGHLGPGRGERARGAGGDRPANAGPDRGGDCPPAVHHPARGPHHGDRPGVGEGGGEPRGAAAQVGHSKSTSKI